MLQNLSLLSYTFITPNKAVLLQWCYIKFTWPELLFSINFAHTVPQIISSGTMNYTAELEVQLRSIFNCLSRSESAIAQPVSICIYTICIWVDTFWDSHSCTPCCGSDRQTCLPLTLTFLFQRSLATVSDIKKPLKAVWLGRWWPSSCRSAPGWMCTMLRLTLHSNFGSTPKNNR